MQSVIVTGGAGFIGSNLVLRLLDETDARVANLDKLTYAGNLDSLESVADHPRYSFVQGDVGDRELLQRLFEQQRPDTIFHLAAESHVNRSIDGPLPFVLTNVVGTCQLLEAAVMYWSKLEEAAQPSFRFVHISTDEVYGELGQDGKFDEDTSYSPNSPYSASKASSDHFVRAYHRTFGLPAIITNCSNNYGPRQFPEKLIPLMILNAVEGRQLPVYGDGQNVRDWLYVDDHCQALLAAARAGKPGETYLIGGDCEKANLEVVHTICDLVQEMCPQISHRPRDLVTFVPDRPGHDWRYAISTEKIQRELGWRAQVTFEEGLRRTVQWYLHHDRWVQRVASGEYQRERLGLEGRRQ